MKLKKHKLLAYFAASLVFSIISVIGATHAQSLIPPDCKTATDKNCVEKDSSGDPVKVRCSNGTTQDVAGSDVLVATNKCSSSPVGTATRPTATDIPVVKGPETDCKDENNDGKLDASECKIIELVNTIFAAVSGLVVLAVVGNMIYAGIQYSMSEGDSGKAAKARQRVRDGVMALVLYLLLSGFIQWLIPGGIFG
jgi:hypothetical protein